MKRTKRRELDAYEEVLNGGFVRLVGSMGDDLSVVRAARVSYNADWREGGDEGSDMRLIRYLWKNKHTSPFEAVTFTFEVKAPIFVLRQWHRHRTWSYNEVSARYTELDEGWYVPHPLDVGKQSIENKQTRKIDAVHRLASEYYEAQSALVDLMDEHCRAGFELYSALLHRGMPRELARTVLPLATYSRMFATVNLRNLLHFLELRDHEHAQWEIREYAQALKLLAYGVVPTCMITFEESRT